MRISIVTETYPPDVNGCAKTVGKLVHAMLDRGHLVQLARPRQREHEHRQSKGSMELLPMPGLAIPCYRIQKFGLPAGSYLESHWESDPPDAVYVATEGPLGYSALGAANRLALPVVSGFHTRFHSYGQYYGLSFVRPLAVRYLKAFHQRSDCTLAPTPHLCAMLEQTGFGETAVLSRGIDTDLFSPAKRNRNLRESWGVGEDDLAVIYVGRLAEEKNIHLAARAYRRIQQLKPHARFVVVGDGPARDKLERKNPGFIFAGWQTGQSLAEHYASGDVFLFPSTTETFGNVVLEAMASGLCVVAYDYAAARMHIDHEQTGLLVPLDDSDLFIQRALRLSDHLGFIRLMGQKARRTTEKISWESIGDRFENIMLQHVQGGISHASLTTRTGS